MAYGLGDVVQQRRLIDASDAGEAYKRISTAKLDALLALCETAHCRRVRLLAYFGEESGPCGNCDTCLAPPQTWDATEVARKALSAIYRTGQRFGAVHLVDVLKGRTSERLLRWDHHRLGVFGIGAELGDAEWRSVFRQLVALGYAEVDHAAYGALKLTPAARPVLRGEQRIEMRSSRPVKPAKLAGARKAHASPEQDLDAGLLARLKEWRREEARRQAVPAYVILHDATLAEIARRAPEDVAALGDIAGMGSKRLERYGAALIALVTTERASQG
jgi:ATP-dependent DNA helicase RecQ